jgi:hypothetical protein
MFAQESQFQGILMLSSLDVTHRPDIREPGQVVV